jgi:predicted nucleic acid-binding protein
MRLIGVDGALAQQAGAVGERCSLRGYDAVHLASALASHGAELAFITSDHELALAAARAGITVIAR